MPLLSWYCNSINDIVLQNNESFWPNYEWISYNVYEVKL